ncbi:MAG: Uma2 family endonuclease [Isosphaeraceae bacterium]|nr:Uma2 family endonuclease [Isosphaeraceae bacterium]
MSITPQEAARPQLHIGPADHGRPLTWAEFLAAEEEEGHRYELARGVLEVSDIPKPRHRRTVANLFRLAAAYDRDHPGLIDYFGGGTEIRTAIPQIDLARHPDFGIVFRNAPLDDVGDLRPVMVAEVVSPSSKTRDYQAKRRDYLDYGIPEYWIVDSLHGQVTVLVRQGEGTNVTWSERVFRGNDVIESPSLPGLTATVADLWKGVAD